MLVAYFSVIANRSHYVLFAGQKLPAEILALTVDPELEEIRNAKEFNCFGCKELHSVIELYKESDIPGECPSCCDEFFCPHGMHPEDSCDQCEEAESRELVLNA